MQRDYLYNKQASGVATQKLPVAPAVMTQQQLLDE